MSTVPFELRIGGSVKTDECFEDVEVDPASELTELERGLTQFCVEHNHEVSIRLGAFEHTVWLFPDLVSALRRMPELLAAFDGDESIQLGFPDDGLDIDCRPLGVLAECVVSRYGASKGSETFVCKRGDVSEALREFATTIAREAVAHGYVKQRATDGYP